jgi:hypothetical protein
MKTTATTEAVSSPPEENEQWHTKWRRNTTCAGQKPRVDWKNDLQTYEENRKSRKPPTPVVGKKPYGKSQISAFPHPHGPIRFEMQNLALKLIGYIGAKGMTSMGIQEYKRKCWVVCRHLVYARRHSSRLLLTDPAPSRDWR